MRRKPGSLLPVEIDILEAVIESARVGEEWIHGYAVAKRISEGHQAKRLISHGTLYKALARLGDSGHLDQRWEDPDAALAEGRPRRRLYRVTGLGHRAAAASRGTARPAIGGPGLVPS
jgi:DNA-binding PadR family transcriptional regulator